MCPPHGRAGSTPARNTWRKKMLPKGFIQLTGYCFGNRALIRLNDILDVWEDPAVAEENRVRNSPTWINTIHVKEPFQVKESYIEVLSKMKLASPA